MRVAHLLAYLSEDASYGGPATVALAQCRALATLGHDVALVAGAPVRKVEESLEGGVRVIRVPAHKVPAIGFAGLFAPTSNRVLRRLAPEVLHVHLARDLLTLPDAWLAQRRGTPVIAQTHGMVDHTRKISGKLIDVLLTKRVLRRSKRVLVLTGDEEGAVQLIEPLVSLARVNNGIEIEARTTAGARRDEILYLARLSERKRPLAFVAMANILATELSHFDFVLVGPDGGEGPAVRGAVGQSPLGDRISWSGPIQPELVSDRLAAARVYVLPAVDEVFPMSIVEAFVAGTPVVTTISLGIAGLCQRYDAAVLTDSSPSSLAKGVREALRPARAQQLAENARHLISSELDIRNVARALEKEYMRAVSAQSAEIGGTNAAS